MSKTSQFPTIHPAAPAITRRSVLLGIAAALAQLTVACNRSYPEAFDLEVLAQSVPAALWAKFRQEKSLQRNARLATHEQLTDLFALLQKWRSPNSASKVADLVMLGDYWLAKAIEWKSVQPLDPTQLQEWNQLSAQPIAWQDFVKRNDRGFLDPQGRVWAAPYRWGTTAIAYRQDKFAKLSWTLQDWSDLWKPELRERISLPDSPRQVIGLTLKKLGHSYNTIDLSQIPNLDAELATLQQQVKLYSSNAYLQPLILKDTWVAVGSSADILNLMQYNRDITAVVPKSGTSLWAELWVRPAGVSSPNATPASWAQWIDFCWKQGNASQLSVLSRAASPILTGLSLSQLPDSVQGNPVLLPDAPILEKSEFLNPLPDEAIEQYRQTWIKMRTS